MRIRPALYTIGFVCFAAFCQQTLSQDSPKIPDPKNGAEQSSTDNSSRLRDGQMAISGRYVRFERMLSQMADVLARQDPERADLLRRAIGKGREDQVKEDIERVVGLLEEGELGTASETQAKVVASLETLLRLLQTEDRRSAAEKEKERLNELLRNVRSVLSVQKSARASTQNSEAPSSAAPAQQNALRESEKLLEDMQQEQDNEGSESERSAKEEANKSETNPPEGKTEESPDENGTQKQPAVPPEPGSQSDGEKSDDKPQKSDSSSGKKPPGKQSTPTPGQEEVEKAKMQMEKALQELRDQNREKAIDHEDKAIEELHKAADALEQMLNQLREEEKEMLLASLEARLQRMLMSQTQIAEATAGLAATPKEDWLDQYFGRCRELAQQQSELETECSQTVNLLREDGTSVSVLMAVEDIELDMRSVSNWLQNSSVGDLTQSVQNDIIESLKLLLETMQREMEEMKQQKQQEGRQNNSPPKSELVDLMAEIRMLRNLQLQVNRRTKQVDGLMQAGSAEDQAALRNQLTELSSRQQRLVESAKELAKRKP